MHSSTKTATRRLFLPVPNHHHSASVGLPTGCFKILRLVWILDYLWMLILIKSDALEHHRGSLLHRVHVCSREIASAATWSQPMDFPIDASFKPTVYFDTSELGIKRWQRSDQWCRKQMAFPKHSHLSKAKNISSRPATSTSQQRFKGPKHWCEAKFANISFL